MAGASVPGPLGSGGNSPVPDGGTAARMSTPPPGPTFLDTVERQMGVAPGSLRYDRPEDQRGVRVIRVFKIEGGGGIHEEITKLAAAHAGLKFSDGFDKGVAWPDVPCADPDAVQVCYLTTGRNQHKPGTTAHRSHHGDLQFWHSMAPAGGTPLTNQQVLEKIIAQAREWYVRGATGASDFQIGKLLHMVQDSYSSSHVIRDASYRVHQFQGYGNQDADAHGEADKKQPSMKSFLEIPGAAAAVSASTQILVYYRDRVPFRTLEAYLREQVYVIAPGRGPVPAGGTAPRFAPRHI